MVYGYDSFSNNVLPKPPQLSQNPQMGLRTGSVPPPLPTSTVRPPSIGTSTITNRPASAAAAATDVNAVPRNYTRRVAMPMQYMSPTGAAAYGGSYNNYPYRPYMNMNMGGYSPYGQQMITNQYQNPVIIAAAENSRPAFESVHSVVQSFNAVSMMLESTFTAMHMSFQALLGVAENFTRLRMFMMKLYSTMVSFKLARWFLNKLFYLLRLVRGGRGSNTEEDLWASLSSTTPEEINPSDGRSWPLVVFTGLLVATPYFVYKLLNSVTPNSNLAIRNNSVNTLRTPAAYTENYITFQAPCDWKSANLGTIPLVKGQTYYTSDERIGRAFRNSGWVLVDCPTGQKGYVPIDSIKVRKVVNQKPLQPVVPKTSEKSGTIVPEQVSPKIVTTSITDEQGTPITLPHELSNNNNNLKNNVQ